MLQLEVTTEENQLGRQARHDAARQIDRAQSYELEVLKQDKAVKDRRSAEVMQLKQKFVDERRHMAQQWALQKVKLEQELEEKARRAALPAPRAKKLTAEQLIELEMNAELIAEKAADKEVERLAAVDALARPWRSASGCGVLQPMSLEAVAKANHELAERPLLEEAAARKAFLEANIRPWRDGVHGEDLVRSVNIRRRKMARKNRKGLRAMEADESLLDSKIASLGREIKRHRSTTRRLAPKTRKQMKTDQTIGNFPLE